MMPTVSSVIAASTDAGSRQKSSALMSAKTGVAPVNATELAVAAKVKEGTMTSAPALTPQDSRPRCRPEVPELTATQARPRPKRSENSSSNAVTSGPWASIPERMTRSTAAHSSSPIKGLAGEMNLVMRRVSPSGVWCWAAQFGGLSGLAHDQELHARKHAGVECVPAVDDDLDPGKVLTRQIAVFRMVGLQDGEVDL